MAGSKRKRYIISGVIAAMVGLGIGILVWRLEQDARRSRKPVSERSRQIIAEIAGQLRNGDIICRAGLGLWSDAAASCSRRDKSYSHVGILFCEAGEWKVIHAEADGFFEHKKGVFTESAASFINVNNKFAVYRLKDSQIAAALTGCAKKYLDMPFDFSFDMEEHKSIYCSELIYLAIRDAGGDLETYVHPELKKRIVPVDSCQDPEIFDKITSVGSDSAENKQSSAASLFQ